MPVFGTQMFGSGGVSGYEIDNSCIFNDDDSPSLSFTPGSAGNQKTWTLSFWFKISRNAQTTSSGMNPFSAGGGNFEFLLADADSTFYLIDGGGLRRTTAQFRDMSAWGHWILASDTTQGSEGNRMKIYYNGVLITSWGVDNTIDENKDFNINSAAAQILGHRNSQGYWDGYLAEFIFVDGTQQAATALGEFDDNGVWRPIDPSGLTFGTNGYWLDFEDSSALGNDVSGNNNDFTPSNLVAGDQSTDTPTNNEVIFNYLNNQQTGGTLTEGNTVYSGPGTRTMVSLTANIPSTGKWAIAFSVNDVSTANGWNFGITKSNNSNFGDGVGSNEDVGASDGVNMSPSGSEVFLYDYINSSSIDPSQAITTSDEFWLAVDMATGKCFLGIYDASATAMVWIAADGGLDGNPADGSNPSVTISAMIGSTDYTFAAAAKAPVLTLIRSADLDGTIPTGYTYFQNVSDLPAPALADPSTNFQTQLYTGNGGTQSITFGGNSDMQPDIVLLKDRQSTYVPNIYDAARGVQKYLQMDNSAVEATDANTLTAFNSDGFSLGTAAWVNGSNNFASWNWAAGNSGAANTAGTINTTTTYVDTTAGISVSTFEGNGTAGQTVGHGLGVKPDVIIIKNRDGTEQWIVYHTAQGATKYGLFNSDAAWADSDGAWNDVEPTTTLVTLGGGGFGTNVSGNSMIMYAFAGVPGFSKFGSFVGNGQADAPFSSTGFKPAMLILKPATRADGWICWDNKRDTHNLTAQFFTLDTTNVEYTGTNRILDFVSNGFKIRSGHNSVNNSGDTYIYLAFAENPFGGEDVSPATAR